MQISILAPPTLLFREDFSKCRILCSVISKQLKTVRLSFYFVNVVFYHIESFYANKILNNVKIFEIF